MSLINESCIVVNILESPNVVFENICSYLTLVEIITFINHQTKDEQQSLKAIVNCNSVFRHIFKQAYQHSPVAAMVRHRDMISKCVYQNFQDHFHHWETSLQYVNWLNEDEKLMLCLELAEKAEQLYTMYKFSWYQYFNNSKIFNMLCRILPFKGPFTINFEDVYNVNLPHRDLYSMEKKLFKCIQITNHNFTMIAADITQMVTEGSMHYNQFNIVNYERFQHNLNVMFHFSHWKNIINWDHFIITGRTVTSALFEVNIAETRNKIYTLNICSYKINFTTFNKQILKIHEQLMNINLFEERKYIFRNVDQHNKLFTLRIEEDDLQYINLHITHCCTHKDLSHLINVQNDLFQLVYIPKDNKILGTPMFFQCVVSGYIIPYGVMLNKRYINYEAITIIQELVYKNFNYFLIPQKASMNVLQQILHNEYSLNHIICYQQVDLYEIQKTFITKYIHENLS